MSGRDLKVEALETSEAIFAHAGYRSAYNVLEGFEGEYGAGNGWRAAGLPWERS